ncbi:protein arginine methyltransferase NDUFAF7, mitochondrial [Neocloeon triangulifer]|uniref:protein arginine methyltransferase NDUFAF7, mitochondrial n=1 Tax=Neocloeon triangulifer TaxID=2078957 RepID=UPI00286F405A|nr:protein arginine methyltransferase NDUFAF7, mitochondrial [Neocloeon triangulifer]
MIPTCILGLRSSFLNRSRLLVAGLVRYQSSSIPLVQSSATALARQLNAKIKSTGPITVADYMKEVLVNPTAGYYPTQESIGAKGDFITSPELCQIFGEMIAIWILNEWQKVGSPKPMQLVELGPGKGTLISDILRVFKHFDQLKEVSVHLIELSQKLREAQAKLLCSEANLGKDDAQQLNITSGFAQVECPIFWHHHLSEVPNDAFTCVIAHEFFDALPVHKLKKTEQGWREILVDIDPNSPDISFRYVLSREPTPMSQLYKPEEGDKRTELEICPSAGALLQNLADRFTEDGGFLLLADYGHNGEKGDTFRGFSNHQLHDPLLNPGSADLTADVDFNYLSRCLKSKALTFGPVTQEKFLKSLGIEVRLNLLLQNEKLSAEHKKNLKSGVEMMINPQEMGKRFKFFSIFPEILADHLKKFPVLGFD